MLSHEKPERLTSVGPGTPMGNLLFGDAAWAWASARGAVPIWVPVRGSYRRSGPGRTRTSCAGVLAAAWCAPWWSVLGCW